VDIVIPSTTRKNGGRVPPPALLAVDRLPYTFTFLYVNDGSTDRTQALLEGIAAADRRVVVLEFSRNFGHQAALTAGLDQATGDYVITMDGDGSTRPKCWHMLDLARSGYDVVLTSAPAKRAFRPSSAGPPPIL